MNLILLEPVDNLGDAGEMVKVRPGYARNFLIPQGLGLPATKANQRELEARLSQRAKLLSERKADAERLREMLEGAKVEMRTRAGEGRIYGSIGTRDIAEAIEAQYGTQIDRRKINLDNPIKELGDYTVTYKPHPEVPIEVTVSVVADEEA
ncbi:MAG: 50S ribosomal protein L9 [Deinococcota bacterium]|jgi:large subunit ribosomal protein L9|nr:50S ribosomal protein L9 [Deinococcota bacterium]